MPAEQDVARVINSSWGGMRAWLNSYQAQNYVRSGQTGSVINGIPWDEWIYVLGRTTPPMESLVKTAAKKEFTQLGVNYSFNVLDAISIRYGAEQSSKLIKNLQDTVRATVRSVVADAMAGKYTVDTAARQISKVVGLHPAWAEATIKFGEKAYTRALKEGKSETAARLFQDKQTEKYAAKLTRARAMNIARTETMTAANVGRYATWEHSVKSGYTGPGSLKEWSPGPGSCPGCMELSGERVPWDKEFSNGQMMPPAHPGCRCTGQIIPEDFDVKPVDWLSNKLPQQSQFDHLAPAAAPKKPRTPRTPKNPLGELKGELKQFHIPPIFRGREEGFRSFKQFPNPGPLTMDSMPKPGKPIPIDDAAKGTNPRRGDISLANNCSSCANAYEMRRRGFDVEAEGVGQVGRYSQEYVDGWWHEKDGTPAFANPLLSVNGLNSFMKKQPAGARGFISGSWEQGGGHVFVWEKTKDGVRYLNPQTPEDIDGSWFISQMKASSLRATRIDDKVPNERAQTAFKPKG